MINIKIIYVYNIYYLVMSDTNESSSEPVKSDLEKAYDTYLDSLNIKYFKAPPFAPDSDEKKAFMDALNQSSADDQESLLKIASTECYGATCKFNPLIIDLINKNKNKSIFTRVFGTGGKSKKTKTSKKSKKSRKTKTSKKSRKSRKSKK